MNIPIINGKGSLEDLADWVLVPGARVFVGKVDGGGDHFTLRPIYEFVMNAQPVRGPNGGTALQRTVSCLPVCFLASIREMTFPVDTPTVPIATLSKQERRMISQAVTQCDELLRTMRAADAGISLAHSVPKQ